MKNEVKLFENVEFGKVRVLMRDGEPWFVAKDVCGILGIANVADAVNSLELDERATVGSNDSCIDFKGLRTDSRVVSESGLYSLVFRSRRHEAKLFRKWVTSEVLPSIRKTGGYGKPSVPPSIKEKIECARAVLECAGLEANQLTLAVDRIHFRELGYSAVEATGVVLVAPVQEQMLTPTEIGRLLSPALSARLVNTLLEERGYQYKVGDKWSPTEKGKAIGGQLRDTAKWHRSGAPVLQLRWPESIVGVLKEEEISTY